jgi:hypothetical protein
MVSYGAKHYAKDTIEILILNEYNSSLTIVELTLANLDL